MLTRRTRLGTMVSMGLALGVYALVRASPAAMPLKYYPVAVSATLLGIFGFSLLRPPSMVERLARLTEPNLPPAAVVYTRQVTAVWCGFFVVNGALAWITAAWSSPEVWALYNGVIAYGLMGVLFAGEAWMRQRVTRHGQREHG